MISHLATRSHFSFLEGLASPQDLVQTAVGHGMAALGMADHLRLTGAVAFYDACTEAGIKPLLGLTLPLDIAQSSAEITLLAQDLEGWGNLCRLSSALLAEGAFDQQAALSLDELAAAKAGLLCLTGGQHSILLDRAYARLGRLLDIFPGQLYVQLDHVAHSGGQIRRLAELAQEMNCPAVAASSVFYLRENESDLQTLLAAMRLNSTLDAVPEAQTAPPGAYFHSPLELQKAFIEHPQALGNIAEVVERCNLQLPLGEQRYPDLDDLPPDKTPVDVLREQAYEGAKQRYGELSSEIEERLEHEIGVIETQGYATLFLIMADVVAYASKADVPIGSRGSASSSLVAHCLGITSPDPVRLKLYFERFLNPARRSPPDIDTDISSNRRDRLLHYVYERYGHDRVAMVSTISRFRRRSALREVAKAYGFSGKAIKGLVSGLPRRGWGPPGRNADASDPYEDMRQQFPPEYGPVFDNAERILGKPRHQSIHPGGMVISPHPMHELVPTQMASKGVLTTQFDLDAVARTGLVKIDLLGIRGLAVLGTLADRLYAKGHSPYERQLDFLAAIPMHDEATTQTIRGAETIGCFQIESPGMRKVLQEIDAQSVDDIMVALALFRPGPITGGLKDAFVRRHLGQEQVHHLHPALEPLLQDTQGVILYQEQVLQIAHELAGLSLVEADLLRRAMSHFDPGKQMQTLKEKFIDGARSISAVPASVGGRIWDLMAAFAGYGFPKAHAAAYAEVSWRSAYCKTHHPAEFMASVLANWGGYYRQRDYIGEAQRLGFELRPPHINYSQRQFCVVAQDGEQVLYMGLNQVHSLTRHAQKTILAQRPFTGLEDFLTRSNPRLQEVRNLIKVGGLDGFGTIPALLARVESKQWRQDQPSLFGGFVEDGGEDWTQKQKAQAQAELLGAVLVGELE